MQQILQSESEKCRKHSIIIDLPEVQVRHSSDIKDSKYMSSGRYFSFKNTSQKEKKSEAQNQKIKVFNSKIPKYQSEASRARE